MAKRSRNPEPDTPGPGSYQSPCFQPQGKDITLAGRIPPPGRSDKIRDMPRFPWDQDNKQEGEDNPTKFLGLAPQSDGSGATQSDLQSQHRPQKGQCRSTPEACPSSASPPSRKPTPCSGAGSDIKRCCRLVRAPRPSSAGCGPGAAQASSQWQSKEPSPGSAATTTATAAFGTAPRMPPGSTAAPGPGSYRPCTLDEAARSCRVLGIGGKGRRELFPRRPSTPGPGFYAPEVDAKWVGRRGGIRSGTRWLLSYQQHGVLGLGLGGQGGRDESKLAFQALARAAAAAAGGGAGSPKTFGMAARFPPCPQGPGPGQYDIRLASAVEKRRATGPVSLTGRPEVTFDPHFGLFLARSRGHDTKSEPSAQSYTPGATGEVRPPPRWSFGGKTHAPAPPESPGPGHYISPHRRTGEVGHSFSSGRASSPAAISGVPWEAAKEGARVGGRVGWGCALDRFYSPTRTYKGARMFMASRRIPIPRGLTRGRRARGFRGGKRPD